MSRLEQLMDVAGVFGDVESVLLYADADRFDPELPLDEDHALTITRSAGALSATRLVWQGGQGQVEPAELPDVRQRFAMLAAVDTGELWQVVAVLCCSAEQAAAAGAWVSDADDACVVDLDSGLVRRRQVSF